MDGTQALVDVARAAGVERLVHISSVAVYGGPPLHGITEDHPRQRTGQPDHDSKVDAEDVVMGARGLHTLVLRPSHVYGPGSTHFTLRPFRMLLGGRVPLVADGRFCFKPVWIGDLLDAITLGLHATLPTGTGLNITAGHTLPWKTLFHDYADVPSVPFRPLSIPLPVARVAGRLGDGFTALTGRKAPIRSETVRVLSSDNSYASGRAAAHLGWTPATSWTESLALLRAWVHEQGGASRFTSPLPSPLEVM